MVDITAGKKIRSPSLTKDGMYVARTWGKVPVYSLVTFLGFSDNGTMHDKPQRQLKDMLKTDLYMFRGIDGSLFTGEAQDAYLVHSTSKARLTFSLPLGAEVAPVVVAETETPAVTPEAPVEADPIEVPAEDPETVVEVLEAAETVEEPVVEVAEEPTPVFVESLAEEPAVESAADRKRRVDAAKKREKRALAKVASEQPTA